VALATFLRTNRNKAAGEEKNVQHKINWQFKMGTKGEEIPKERSIC
jgi:hypothetical protein